MDEFATIMNLFRSSCPSAIAWFVISIYVFSINRVFLGRWISYVFMESLKAVSPAFTDCNSSAAVIAKESRFRIFDSVNDASPSIINFGSTQAMCPGSITERASTFFAFTHSKIAASDAFNLLAFASANPFWMSVFSVFSVAPKNCPKAKCLTGQVNEPH